MRWILVLTGLLGCATAGPDTTPSDAPPIDAAPDATPIDATLTTTLTQTADTNVAIGQSIACLNEAGPFTRDNSWYRVFSLAAAGVTSPFAISEVTFGVELAEGPTHTIEVKLGTYGGTPGAILDTALITPLTSTTVSVAAATNPLLITAPLTAMVPAGAQLVVEIAAPDYNTMNGRQFFAGATAGAETAPGYVRSTACAIEQPQSMEALVANTGSIVIDVTGTHY